jgi:hypothetical protein
MNKTLKGLLVAVLAISAVQAKDTTDKTFMMPRPVGVDLPRQAVTFAELTQMEKEDRFGGNFQIVPFFQQSTHNADVAKYFLFNHEDKVTLATSGIADKDLNINYLLHDINGGIDGRDYSATLKLDPQQTVYGFDIQCYQNMDKILRGLYLNIDLPVAHVENKVRPSFTATGDVADQTAAQLKENLEEYLKGNYEVAMGDAVTNAQEKLTHAKIAGKQSETGVADIDIALGYKFLNKEAYHAALAIGLTIPTGNEADGVHMFESIVGNGKHFGLGGDFCAGARIWGDIDHNVKLHLKAKYRYLFENSERRTLGIDGYKFSPYLLLVKAGVAADANTSLVPAANVLTRNVDVTPGSQFDGILGMSYNNGGFNLDLGYNLYFRESENVHLKGKFEAGKYAVADRTYSTAAGHTATPETITDGINGVTDGGAANGTTAILSKETLNVDAAKTPSQFTNAIYGGLGYIFKEWDTPLMLGLGGKYEWPAKNSALEQWNAYAKIGIGF